MSDAWTQIGEHMRIKHDSRPHDSMIEVTLMVTRPHANHVNIYRSRVERPVWNLIESLLEMYKEAGHLMVAINAKGINDPRVASIHALFIWLHTITSKVETPP